MYREFNVLDQIDGPLLWRAWAEMEWEEGRSMLALKVLVASAAPVVEEVDLGEFARMALGVLLLTSGCCSGSCES